MGKLPSTIYYIKSKKQYSTMIWPKSVCELWSWGNESKDD